MSWWGWRGATPTTTARRWRLATLSIATVVVVAACGSDEPASSGSSASSGGSTPSPTTPSAETAAAPTTPPSSAGTGSPPPSTTFAVVSTPMAAEPSTVYPPGDIDPALNPLIDVATRDLATRLGVDAGSIQTSSAVSVQWPDGSLGCPRPGMAYIQVLQDGAVIELSAGGKTYRYHAGGGRSPFFCDQPLTHVPQRISPPPR